MLKKVNCDWIVHLGNLPGKLKVLEKFYEHGVALLVNAALYTKCIKTCANNSKWLNYVKLNLVFLGSADNTLTTFHTAWLSHAKLHKIYHSEVFVPLPNPA